jgi:hypothetical protein
LTDFGTLGVNHDGAIRRDAQECIRCELLCWRRRGLSEGLAAFAQIERQYQASAGHAGKLEKRPTAKGRQA